MDGVDEDEMSRDHHQQHHPDETRVDRCATQRRAHDSQSEHARRNERTKHTLHQRTIDCWKKLPQDGVNATNVNKLTRADLHRGRLQICMIFINTFRNTTMLEIHEKMRLY